MSEHRAAAELETDQRRISPTTPTTARTIAVQGRRDRAAVIVRAGRSRAMRSASIPKKRWSRRCRAVTC